MPVTRKIGSAPLVMPSDAAAIAAAAARTSRKANDAPGPDHVRVQRGAPARATAPGRTLFDFRAPGRP